MAVHDDNLATLLTALSNASTYPHNGSPTSVHSHFVREIQVQLRNRARSVFCPESRAAIVLRELNLPENGYEETTLNNAAALNLHLKLAPRQYRPDPRQRFIFINAKNSRDYLRITEQMLLQLLTYHQVTPAFLSFVLPFGRQTRVRDFHLSGFHSESCLTRPCKRLEIRELGRSGQHLELCYNLKAPERKQTLASEYDSATFDDIWSVRQCSTYHRFDLQTEHMTWIMIKANSVIRDAIQQQLDTSEGRSGPHSTFDGYYLRTALEVHRIIISWSGGGWQWYINDLETELEAKAQRIVFIPQESIATELPQSPQGPPPPFTPLAQEPIITRRQRNRSWSLVSISKTIRRSTSWSLSRHATSTTLNSGSQQLTLIPTGASFHPIPTAIDDFTFSDLQAIHYLEEKANEALLTMKANSHVVQEIAQQYSALLSQETQLSIVKPSKTDLQSFLQHLASVDKDCLMQQSRLEALLKKIADRKSLVQSILQYRNMEATKLFAARAEGSQRRMEDVTHEMHEIAKRTQAETVSMRTITLVTLFFLPGTFISTLMSTPLVEFDSASPNFSWSNVGVGALKLYLVISLPLVVLTFLVWWAVHWWEKRKEEKDRLKRSDKSFSPV